MPLIVVLSLLLFSLHIYANDAGNIAKKTHLANINTLLIFTSEEGLGSGRYHFTDVGVDMEIYSLPFTYHFKSETDINYFLVGTLGYSRTFISEDVELENSSILNHENHLRTYTVGIGGGIRYKIEKDLSISGGLEFIYSKAGASVKKPDDDLGDAISDFFSQNYNDNITYKFFTNLEYKTVIDDYKPYVTVSYKMYETKSSFDFDDLNSFNSQSGVATLALGVESPSILNLGENYLTVEGYYKGNYLSGSVRDVVQFSTFSSVGGVMYLNTPEKNMWIKRFFLEVNTVNSSGLDGHNIAVGFSIDF